MRGWSWKALVCVMMLTAAAWAQHGGAAGGHGGMGGGHSFAGAGHMSGASGMHAAPAYGNRWAGNGWRGNGWGWRGYPYRFRGFRYPWYGWNYGYAGYGYPWYGWYDDFDYSDSYPPQGYNAGGYPPPYDPGYAYLPPSGSSASYASEGEVQRIQSEVAQLRAQQASRYTEPAHASTTLIYRDGHKETVENYAVVDSTVWIFNKDRARKVPLSELDVLATQRDNEEHGGEFVIPETR